MHESDLLQAVALALPRPLTLRRARMLVQTLGGMTEDAATDLVMTWIQSGCLVIGCGTESGGYEVAVGESASGPAPMTPEAPATTAWSVATHATRRVAEAVDRCKATLGTRAFPGALAEWRAAMSALSAARRDTVARTDVRKSPASDVPSRHGAGGVG